MINYIKKNKGVLIKVLLLYLFQALTYFLSKFTPIKEHAIGWDIDHKIPFIAFFGLFYVSWFIAIIMVPLLLNKYNKNELKKHYCNVIVAIIICGLFYLFYPTTSDIRPDVHIKGLSTLTCYLVYYFDGPMANLFPSMHCLMCFYYIYYMMFNKNIDKRIRIGISLWAIMIILSTMFAKQHVVIDVIGAFVISALIYAINSFIFRKGKNK